MTEIPNVLAERYASPAMQAIWSAKEKVILDIAKSPDFTFEQLRTAIAGPKDIH